MLLSSLAFAGSCGTRLYPPVDGELPGMDAAGGAPGATDAASGPFFCRGAQALAGFSPEPGTPYVTLSDGAGQGCVFLMGDALADPNVCGDAQLAGYREPDCPFTTVDFNVWSDPFFMTVLGVQGAYAWVERSGMLQNGRVLEMVIDDAAANLTRGHFRLGFDDWNGLPADSATGTFALCTSVETSVEPCRQPSPPVK